MTSLRPLTAADRREVEALYLSAPSSDRQTRFHSGVNDDFVRDYVAKTLSAASEVIGAFDGDQLRGIAEIHINGDDSAELAFLVSPECQHRGLGAKLMASALSAAHERGAARALVVVCAGNRTMRRLALSNGLKRFQSEGDWSADVDLEPECDLHFPSVYQLVLPA